MNRAFLVRSMLLLLVLSCMALPSRGISTPASDGPGKLCITHYVAWCSGNNNVKNSNDHYDAPLLKTAGTPLENFTAELKQMSGCGIDAVAVDVVVKGGNWAFIRDFVGMLQAAEQTPVKVLPCLDEFPRTVAEVDAIMPAMIDLLRQWGGRPGWLHVGGRPVVTFFWATRGRDPAVFQHFRDAAAKEGFDLFMLGDIDPGPSSALSADYLSRYSGQFDMNYTFAEYGIGQRQPPMEAFRVLKQAAPTITRSGTWAASIVPGYLGAWVSGRNDYYIPFRNLDGFNDNWKAAIEADPTWLMLTTWNDRDETPIQPTLYQWETLSEISAYYIHLWKQGVFPKQPRRLYAAYPREQLIGTAQRLEILSLPGESSGDATVSGTLRSLDGKTVGVLGERALQTSRVSVADWAIDTTSMGKSPIVTPFLTVKDNGTTTSYRLPAFVLRSGWIENQNIIKVPLRRMGEGQTQLQVDFPGQYLLHASLSYQGNDPIVSAALFRNDKRIAHFDPSHAENQRIQLVIKSIPEGRPGIPVDLSVTNGAIVRAARSDSNGVDSIQYSPEHLQTKVAPGWVTALEITGTPDTALHFIEGNGRETIIPVARILSQGTVQVDGQPIAVGIPRFDALADTYPDYNGALDRLELSWMIPIRHENDSYHVRLETTSGKMIETSWVYPGLTEKVPLQKILAIRSPLSLDIHKSEEYVTPPESREISLQEVAVHPGILQREGWNFDDGEKPGRDSYGDNDLILGRGDGYSNADSKRIPAWESTGGPDHSGCLEFDGVDDRAQIPVQQEPKGPFTLTLDLFPEGGLGKTQNILSGTRSGDSPAGIFLRLIDNGRLEAGRYGVVAAQTPSPLPLEKWTRIKVIFTGSQLEIYVDGALAVQAGCSPDFRRFGNSRIYLGGPDAPLHGKLDNVVIEGFVPSVDKK